MDKEYTKFTVDAVFLTIARAKLSDELFLQMIDFLCETIGLGSTNLVLKDDLQIKMANKIIQDYQKAKRRHHASVENGKKGGRPKHQQRG